MMSTMGEARWAERALELEAAELTMCDPETSAVLCTTYLYEPNAGEESLGSLFLVAETINPDAMSGTRLRHPQSSSEASDDEEMDSPKTARTVIAAMSTAIREEHYQDPRRPMLQSFEAALASANASLAAHAERGDSTWLGNLHAAVGVFHDTTLHVSRVGAAEILLARRGSLTDIGEGLSDTNVRHPHHAFTNIASGTITEHDVIALASPRLVRLIPRDRLAAFLTGKHPKETATYIRDLLAETADQASVATLILRAVRAPIALPAPRVPSLPQRPAPPAFPPPPPRSFPQSLRRTPPRLHQSPWSRAFSIARRSGTLFAHFVTSRVAPKLTRAAKAGVLGARAAAAKTAVSAASRLALHRSSAGGPPLPAPRSLGEVGPTARSSAIRSLTQTVVTGASGAPGRVRNVLTRWPTSTKIFLVSTLGFAILFSGSLVMLKRKWTEDAAIRAASEKLEEARTKKSAADAALIYDNVDEARQLLKAARERATEVEATAYYDAQVAELLAHIQETADQTERVTRTSEPTIVGDFGSVAPSGRALGLAVIGPHLYAFSPETNAILELTIDGGETRTVSQTSQGIGYFKETVPLAAEQMLLYATDTPGLALFDTARGDLIRQDLQSLPEGTKNIRALATFGSRLYLLLPEHRQIYGFSKTLAGYQGGAPWLKDQTVPVERAVSMGVDGYIYLLTDDGKIVKLLKGAPVEFAQTELATPVAAPTKLLINETLKHLYVLDPREKRVIVYDTTGKLTRQFVFPNARDLRDIAIGGKEETLYVLDQTSVYKVSLK